MLQVKDIDKRFGAVRALKQTSLSLQPGEIRALLGANGSGKSTLVKVLGGMVKNDKGCIELDGRPISIHSPQDSKKHGIAVAYQDLSLLPKLSIAENIMMGNEPRNKAGFADNRKTKDLANELLKKLDINLASNIPVDRVDISIQSLIEVAKALARKPRILILDEVTASLHHDQVKTLFSLLKELQKEGLAILFVSHRLDEVFALCDTATILRGGETVTDIDLSEVKNEDLIYHMTGKRIDTKTNTQEYDPAAQKDAPFLATENLCAHGKYQDASITVYKGEIIGLGGLQGQGQQEFLRTIYGAQPYSKGTIRIDGKCINYKSPSKAVKSGIGFISGDREKEGIFPMRSVAENLFLVRFAMRGLFSRAGTKGQQKQAQEMIDKLKVVAAGAGVAASSLSGGNQQKLVIGRWLLAQPRLLLLDDPTKGVDIGARSEIHELLFQMSKAGVTILLLSSDNIELLQHTNRIYVFYEGKIVRELQGGQKCEETLISSMLGVSDAKGRKAV